MQITFSYSKEDKWVLDEVEEKAYLEGKSKSAVIVAILEEHFTKGVKDRRNLPYYSVAFLQNN